MAATVHVEHDDLASRLILSLDKECGVMEVDVHLQSAGMAQVGPHLEESDVLHAQGCGVLYKGVSIQVTLLHLYLSQVEVEGVQRRQL